MLSKQLQDQIEQEAKHKGETHMFIPMDGNYSSYDFHGFIAERSWLSAATKYAALYETAIARAERAERALEAILNTNHDNYEKVIMKVKQIAAEAITPNDIT